MSEQRAIVTFVDVEEPGLNVYQDVWQMGSDYLKVGAIWDFGLPGGNSMRGAWRVLSFERPWKDGKPDAENIRVNVQRVSLEPKFEAECRFRDWAGKFVVAGVLSGDDAARAVDELTTIFEEVALRA